MKIDAISVGETLNIELETDVWETTKVQEILGDVIIVNRISHYDSTKEIHKNDKLLITVKRDFGYANFEAEFLGNETYEGVYSSRIRAVSPMQQFQRRSAFRARVETNVFIRLFDKNDARMIKSEIWGRSVDISEFGMRVNVLLPIEFNSFIDCEFELDDKRLNRRGRVVRSFQDKENGGQFVAINFLDHDENILKFIRKYLFEFEKKNRSVVRK